ncbi:hypothetical protein RCL1_001333 [Eukaryota sp. TZLM3-RCL]
MFSSTHVCLIKQFLSHQSYLNCSRVSVLFRSLFSFEQLPLLTHQCLSTKSFSRCRHVKHISHLVLQGVAETLPSTAFPSLTHLSIKHCSHGSSFFAPTYQSSSLLALSCTYSFCVSPNSTIYSSIQFLSLRGTSLTREYCLTLGSLLVNLKVLDLSFCYLQDPQALPEFFDKNLSSKESPFVLANFYGMSTCTKKLKNVAQYLLTCLEKLFCMYIIAPSLGHFSDLVGKSFKFNRKWITPVKSFSDLKAFSDSFSSIDSLLSTLFLSSYFTIPSFLAPQHPLSLVFGYDPNNGNYDSQSKSEPLVSAIEHYPINFLRFQSIDPLIFDPLLIETISSRVYFKIVEVIAVNTISLNFNSVLSLFSSNLVLLHDILSNRYFSLSLTFDLLKSFLRSNVFPSDSSSLLSLLVSLSPRLGHSPQLVLDACYYGASKCLYVALEMCSPDAEVLSEALENSMTRQHVDVVSVLLEAGAKITSIDLFFQSFKQSNLDVLSLLLSHKAFPIDFLNQTNSLGRNSFLLACDLGNVALMGTLVELSANVFVVDSLQLDAVLLLLKAPVSDLEKCEGLKMLLLLKLTCPYDQQLINFVLSSLDDELVCLYFTPHLFKLSCFDLEKFMMICVDYGLEKAGTMFSERIFQLR